MLGNYRVSKQLRISRVVLSSMESVMGYNPIDFNVTLSRPRNKQSGTECQNVCNQRQVFIKSEVQKCTVPRVLQTFLYSPVTRCGLG
jgi:hypothetical protein